MAENLLMQVLLEELSIACQCLRRVAVAVHDSLAEPADAEEMGEGNIPETAEFAIRGDLECLVADNLDPAIATLQKAAQAARGLR